MKHKGHRYTKNDSVFIWHSNLVCHLIFLFPKPSNFKTEWIHSGGGFVWTSDYKTWVLWGKWVWGTGSVALETETDLGGRGKGPVGTTMTQEWRDFEWSPSSTINSPCQFGLFLSQSTHLKNEKINSVSPVHTACWHTHTPEGTGRFPRGYTGTDRLEDMMSWFLNSTFTFSWNWSAWKRACSPPFSFSVFPKVLSCFQKRWDGSKSLTYLLCMSKI